MRHVHGAGLVCPGTADGARSSPAIRASVAAVAGAQHVCVTPAMPRARPLTLRRRQPHRSGHHRHSQLKPSHFVGGGPGEAPLRTPPPATVQPCCWHRTSAAAAAAAPSPAGGCRQPRQLNGNFLRVLLSLFASGASHCAWADACGRVCACVSECAGTVTVAACATTRTSRCCSCNYHMCYCRCYQLRCYLMWLLLLVAAATACGYPACCVVAATPCALPVGSGGARV